MIEVDDQNIASLRSTCTSCSVVTAKAKIYKVLPQAAGSFYHHAISDKSYYYYYYYYASVVRPTVQYWLVPGQLLKIQDCSGDSGQLEPMVYTSI